MPNCPSIAECTSLAWTRDAPSMVMVRSASSGEYTATATSAASTRVSEPMVSHSARRCRDRLVKRRISFFS